MTNLLRLFILKSVLMTGVAQAAPTSLSAEALGAKTLLEEMLARRFSQELATKVEKNAFSIGAQLDLTELPKRVIKPEAEAVQPEPMSDLMLGTLDPEELLKKFSVSEAKPAAEGFLRNYRIKTVNVSVGLRDDLGSEFKNEVEKWLKQRVKAEFGTSGKGSVSFIKMLPIAKKDDPTKNQSSQDVKPDEDFWDKLNKFQSLAGQIVLALALILGIIIFKLLTSSSNSFVNKTGDGSTINVGGPNQEAAKEEDLIDEKTRKMNEEELKVLASQEIEALTNRLNAILPRVAKDLESVVRSWCQAGEPGRLKLACFAEAVGREIGRLPIPVDALADTSKVFARMADLDLMEKRDTLQKAYWDLLAVMNLGAETLNQPFGYMGSLNVGVVSQVLMDQNPKMKTLVSLFLPSDLRVRYLRGLDESTKRELLQSAAKMSEIPADELRSLDGALMSKIRPTNTSDMVPLEMTINKLVAALTPREEVTLIYDMKGPAIDAYKRSVPSIAFLGEWPDDSLTVLLSRVSADEIVALIRMRPDVKERFIDLCPQLTAEMAIDELRLPDRMSDATKDEWLGALARRVREMVQLQEVSLELIFTNEPKEGLNEVSRAA